MGKYTVYAGDERATVIVGQHLEKGSGQTMTAQGSPKIAYSLPAGDVGFPNMTEAWGVRLDKNGKIPESPLSVTSNDYDGKIKWLNWGEKGGCQIVARWLSGYNTLDQQYQKLVLKADDRIGDDSDAWNLVLKTGVNEFDETTDAFKVSHLQIHSYNRMSLSKNPNNTSFMFFEKNEEDIVKEKSKDIDAKWSAIDLVKKCAADNTLAALVNLKRAVEKLITEDLKDEELYVYLMNLADAEPVKLLAHVEDFKKMVSNTFVMADSFKLLDLTKNGVIACGKDVKEVVGTDIPAKGKEMLDYLLANCFKAKENTTIFLIKAITDKIK